MTRMDLPDGQESQRSQINWVPTYLPNNRVLIIGLVKNLAVEQTQLLVGD